MPQITGQLRFADRFGSWKVRWNIGRNTYLVPPGLYALGAADADSPVIVTANYKMSYDLVRHSLAGRNCWLLVLETFGINVWCAAGKGSFGTHELIHRLELSGLARILSHRTLLLPILGAPGVAAHEVTKATGFHIRYAAIRAADLPEFLDNGMTTTPAMRELSFTLYERLILTPVEFILALKFTLPVAALLVLLGWGLDNPTLGLSAGLALLGALAAGTLLVPVLLPWLPGASFAGKGAFLGVLLSSAWVGWAAAPLNLQAALGSVLALTAVSAFWALNFTGSTPYTSRSGVRKEMAVTLPLLAAAFFCALILWTWAAFA